MITFYTIISASIFGFTFINSMHGKSSIVATIYFILWIWGACIAIFG